MWKCDILLLSFSQWPMVIVPFRGSFPNATNTNLNHSFAAAFSRFSLACHTLPQSILTIELLLFIDCRLSTVWTGDVNSIRFKRRHMTIAKTMLPPSPPTTITHTRAHTRNPQSDNWQWQKFMSCFCLDKRRRSESPSHSGHRQHMVSSCRKQCSMRPSFGFSLPFFAPRHKIENKPSNSHEQIRNKKKNEK